MGRGRERCPQTTKPGKGKAWGTPLLHLGRERSVGTPLLHHFIDLHRPFNLSEVVPTYKMRTTTSFS